MNGDSLLGGALRSLAVVILPKISAGQLSDIAVAQR